MSPRRYRHHRRSNGSIPVRLEPAPRPAPETDPHAQAVVAARLGRDARDVLEATVVQEAWMGRSARVAMAAAQDLVNLDGPPPRAISNMDPFASADQTSVIAEGLTLVLLIVSIAAWATPIAKALGPDVLPRAIRVALPVAVAMQWGLRSRYLGRPKGMACLARDGLGFWALLLVVIDAPLLLISGWGPVAAMLIPIWVGGAILTRRGWGPIYAAVLVIGTVALSDKLDPHVMLGSLTAITLLMCYVAVRSRRQRTDAQAGSVRRAITASLIGGLVGVLLVGDPSLGWGVHGTYPAVALIPSVIGSYWGGYYLWNFYDAVPRGLRGASLKRAGGVALSDPAMSIFVGAIARLVAATVVLSVVVVVIGSLSGGTDVPSVFVAFGCVGLMSMLVGMLESFSLQSAALIVTSAAVIAELTWPVLVPSYAPGVALAVGASVGVVLSLPPLVVRLAYSGRVLATTLWIQ